MNNFPSFYKCKEMSIELAVRHLHHWNMEYGSLTFFVVIAFGKKCRKILSFEKNVDIIRLNCW